ncbi:MAG: twin-arginine translocation pathway signal protein [Oceanicaulis sp.]
MPTRRFILTAAGATAVVLGAGLGGTAVLAPSTDAARAPWAAAGAGFGDPRLDALSYAVLAPSPHNRQPWRIALQGADAMTVFCDLDRRLPETDPLDRQIVIGFGAFLELLRMAAADLGYAAEITPFPDGVPAGRLDDRPVAHVRVHAAAGARDPLFAHVLDRRTVRTPFSGTVPGEAVLARVFSEPMAGFTARPERVSELKSLCREGWEIEHANRPTLEESVDLTRIGANEVNASPDGISLSGPAIEAVRLTGTLSRAAMRERGSWAYRQVLDFYLAAIEASPAFGWLLGEGDTQLDRLDAGQRWLRVHLHATREGLALQPLSQVLQEFEPMRPLLRRAHDLLAPDGGRVHGLFRLGFAASPPPAPRWPLESRITPA